VQLARQVLLQADSPRRADVLQAAAPVVARVQRARDDCAQGRVRPRRDRLDADVAAEPAEARTSGFDLGPTTSSSRGRRKRSGSSSRTSARHRSDSSPR
jgi:hypothetical protein